MSVRPANTRPLAGGDEVCKARGGSVHTSSLFQADVKPIILTIVSQQNYSILTISVKSNLSVFRVTTSLIISRSVLSNEIVLLWWDNRECISTVENEKILYYVFLQHLCYNNELNYLIYLLNYKLYSTMKNYINVLLSADLLLFYVSMFDFLHSWRVWFFVLFVRIFQFRNSFL